MHDHKFCPALWFSGFFGFVAIAHIVRLILRVPAVIAGYDVPMAVSVVFVVVAGAISLGLLYLSCCKSCKKE
jgi:hypothetical protein